MPTLSHPFHSVGLAKEVESPENPGALEKRVALIPEDVKTLVDHGVDVYVEHGAGEGVGFSDAAYLEAGAQLQDGDAIYRDKDLIIKFKGPSMASIPLMTPGSTLFCMAHFASFPERAEALRDRRITVLAMEKIVEHPERISDTVILGRMAADNCLEPYRPRRLDVRVIGWSERLVTLIQRIARRDPRSLTVLSLESRCEDLDVFGRQALYVYDSLAFDDPHGLLPFLRKKGANLYDLRAFEEAYGAEAIAYYKRTTFPKKFGLRRIQCLHETGQAGARYGFELLTEVSKKKAIARDANVVILGYGNVAMGAAHECHTQGTRATHILGPRHTRKTWIDPWLRDADLVINGAEQPPALRGKNYLVTKLHVASVIQPGSVVIDLVGGSSTNRSPVESVLQCTFLTDPYFVERDVYISSLWGWPMMGMMRETAIRYSGQIVDVLLGQERLIDGLVDLTPGVAPALECGPYSAS